MDAFKVSVSAVSRSTDVCRYDLDATTLTVGSMGPIEMFGGVSGWPRCAYAFQVSRFDFFH